MKKDKQEKKCHDECECDEKESCEKENCDCHEHNCGCKNGEECTCGDDCHCGESCTCHKDDENEKGCHGENEHECHCEHHHHDHHAQELAAQYLDMAQRLQADFDNYRKRVAEQLDYQREEGKRSVIEVFLPCLDTFKEAKKSITDEKVLAGVEMIEEKILNALKTLNVEKIETIGQKFDHNLHEVVAILKDESKDDDIILDEFQAGYKLNGRVIRYAKVVVNKL